MQFLGMLTFAGLSILTSEIIYIIYRTICKMAPNAGLQNTEHPIKYELGHVTSPNLLGDVMSPISRH